ncbi:Regulator of cell death-1 (rcd-1)-like protein [Podospora pseudopauciseta]|uniref:Regulator of cell death-1 (Rcd-1)-like protein n=1 Tax=Podospora pseudopauciseta TaxID=2093780 RepID=A0ABR0HW56_9PEZI|nr:Regulator of cell death-1 (rcd-1)-like protein [Podospora pseudopauciseta]
MYLDKSTKQGFSSSRSFRRSGTGSDLQPFNSAQTAALIVFGVLIGLITTGIIIWCCCCRGPGWQRRTSSRSRVKIIRMSGPRGEKGEKGSPGPMGMQGLPGLPAPTVFLPLPASAAPVPIRPLGPRGMLPGALPDINTGARETTKQRSRECSPKRQHNSLHIHPPHPHSRPQPSILPTQYSLPPHLQKFAQPLTPAAPSVSQLPSQPLPPSNTQIRLLPLPSQPPLRIQPLRIPPPTLPHPQHRYYQPRPPIAKIINDHAAGVTRPLPLALPIGRHGMVNLALKYQVHSEKGASSRPVSSRGLESGYQSAYCESSAESDDGGEMGYESMENFGRVVEEDRRGRWARMGV